MDNMGLYRVGVGVLKGKRKEERRAAGQDAAVTQRGRAS